MRTGRVIPFLTVLWLTAICGYAWQQNTFEIKGVVRDASGHGVPAASVELRVQGNDRIQRLKTDSDGVFVFSGLDVGLYAVGASRGDDRSTEVSVRGTGGAVEHVELELTNGVKPAEMDFSDLPNFTVAGVTDWTAAGGHGSDTTLRASESLTRETLRLEPAEPSSAAAPSALDANTEQRLRRVLDGSPRDLKANEELGRLYLNAGRYSEAVALLEAANEVDPAQKDDEYELALALTRSGDPAKARVHVDRLLAAGDKPQWHRLDGEVDEKLGNPLGAVHAFELAVKEDPSEENYFAWGTELLEHRAIWQAKEVFETAVKVYPNSPRLLTALGTALFSAALYKEAAQRYCEASDLRPNDAQPYLFMGRVEIAAPDPLPCVETKLKHFVDLQPENALANYYYAMAYWKQRQKSAEPRTLSHVEELLNRAVTADPKCSNAYLELGNLHALQQDFQHAVEDYRKAVNIDPQLSEAHYRLGVAYDRLGKKDEAAREFKLHDEIEKKQAAEVDRERRQIKQFLVLVNGKGPAGAQP